MRALVLYPYLPAPGLPHGSSRVVHGLLRALAPHAEVHLVCAHRPQEAGHLDSVREMVASLTSVERPFAQDLRGASRTGERVSTARRLITTRFPTCVIKLRRRPLRQAIREVYERLDPQVVQVELAVMAQHVDLLRATPAVLADHEAGGLGQAQPRRWRHYVRAVYPLFARVQTLCAEDAEALEETGIARPGVRPVGLDFAPPPERRPEPGRLLFFGSARHEPNREALAWLLRELLPALKRQRPDRARLCVAGFPEEDALCAEARAAGAETLGFVPDLQEELARAAVVLAPIRSGRGVRIKNLEALASGAPLLTTPLGAHGLGIVPDRHAMVARDRGEWLEVLGRLLDGPGSAEEKGQRGAALVRQRHGLDALARQTVALWTEVTEEHRAADPDETLGPL